ncbi:MAG: hypothetical protein CK529_05350 [Rhodospirillaceae bacterium]|nr:MAG: hypothetical protein CK529_05350 [Rhodospirillaceae bacterium]
MAIEADVDGRPQLCPLAQDVKARSKRQGFIEAGQGGVKRSVAGLDVTARVVFQRLGAYNREA